MDASGNLYGTTFLGGKGHAGIVFELKPGGDGTWAETAIHNFCSARSCKDGADPMAGLALDSSGNLYGTTASGGSQQRPCGAQGCGVVFELTPAAKGTWKDKTLHSFNGDDGRQPQAGLIFDSAGDLYGTTFLYGPQGNGTVFELLHAKDGQWTEKILASKELGSTASLIFDSKGNLYGTSGDGGYGYGAVFELTPAKEGRWTLKWLYKFPKDGQDGFEADTNLIFDTAGNLYGTTAKGGSSGSGCGGYGCGTVFKITP
jgi:uncharacterized repeat protein (TIGR03803 family)